ncbi:MAG: endonuclease/exonuclease/phosphatase family protein, partial [Verrucomicrobiota bacterium]|nr:endonuclease/exonuclease/phosphatase family protein [Verrucomicrobiota bacterium]
NLYRSLGATTALVLLTATGAGAETAVTTAFWNIRWFPGGRPNAYRGEQIKQTRAVHADIVRLNADVIAFEEVRDWDNAALAVQPLSGFKVDVCSTFPPREGQTDTQQVAILSRLEPMSAWSEMWKPGSAITPPRGFAFAAYQLAPKKLLLVYALHLKSNRGEAVEDIAIREESMRQLADHMKAMNQAYSPLGAITWVVGGDFNTAPDDPRFTSEKTTQTLTALGLKWCWENMPLATRITLPPDARFPAACFDHIYYRGATLRKAEVIATSENSSDHRAVRAELVLP